MTKSLLPDAVAGALLLARFARQRGLLMAGGAMGRT